MKMRAELWVLLMTAMTLASGLGCGEGTEPSTEGDNGMIVPAADAGTGQNPLVGTNDSGAGPTQPRGQQPTTTDAGSSGSRTDAGPNGTDAGSATPEKDAGGSVTGQDGGSQPAPDGGGGGPVAATDSVDKNGPYAPTHITNGGPKGTSWVFHPTELGKDGVKHPIFNWGPGAGTGPSQYTDHLNRLASHGFVVISQPSSGTGADEIPALDWLIAQNEKSGSPFYQKLDTKKVGAGGHSKGSLTTMKMAKDPRLSLYVLVCGGSFSGSGGGGAADIHGPTVILGGDTDNPGTPNFEGDYKEIKSPVVFLTKNGTDHIACARNNLSPWTAFMRWHFYGEEKWKPNFFEGGEYCKTPWKCKSKNF